MKQYTLHQMVLVAVLLIFSSTPTGAAVVVFGDSLSDVGNVSIATGGVNFAPPYADGQASNGPVWVQTFSSKLGFGPTLPSLAGGKNFAFAGATTGSQVDSDPPGIPDITTQVTQYLALHSTAIGADYHLLLGGANDAFAGIASLDPSELVSGTGRLATQAAGNMAQNLNNLIAAGAQRVLIANLPTLSETPLARALGSVTESLFDLYTDVFNETLETAVASIEQSTGVDVLEFDLGAFLGEVAADPISYGLTNVTDPALNIDLDPASAMFGSAITPPTLQGNADEYFFFDIVHPTATVHELIGQQAHSTAVPEPGSILIWGLLIGFLVAGNVVNVRWRRSRTVA